MDLPDDKLAHTKFYLPVQSYHAMHFGMDTIWQNTLVSYIVNNLISYSYSTSLELEYNFYQISFDQLSYM